MVVYNGGSNQVLYITVRLSQFWACFWLRHYHTFVSYYKASAGLMNILKGPYKKEDYEDLFKMMYELFQLGEETE